MGTPQDPLLVHVPMAQPPLSSIMIWTIEATQNR